jgi:hypothetical protein
MSAIPRRFIVALAVASLSTAATSALAETIVLDCQKADADQNICDSHWVIDGDAKTVTWHWCESPDTTEQRNVEITDDKITFDEAFMLRHYEFDRKTGRMTITAAGMDENGDYGERFLDGISACIAPGK